MQKLKVRPTFTNNLGQKPRGRRVNYPIIIHSEPFCSAPNFVCSENWPHILLTPPSWNSSRKHVYFYEDRCIFVRSKLYICTRNVYIFYNNICIFVWVNVYICTVLQKICWSVENLKNFIWFGFEFCESYLWGKFNGSSFYWLSRVTENQFEAASILSSAKMSEKETMAKRVEKKIRNNLR